MIARTAVGRGPNALEGLKRSFDALDACLGAGRPRPECLRGIETKVMMKATNTSGLVGRGPNALEGLKHDNQNTEQGVVVSAAARMP